MKLSRVSTSIIAAATAMSVLTGTAVAAETGADASAEGSATLQFLGSTEQGRAFGSYAGGLLSNDALYPYGGAWYATSLIRGIIGTVISIGIGVAALNYLRDQGLLPKDATLLDIRAL